MRERLHNLFILYALRNPFYSEILRKKIIDPILEMLFSKTSLFRRLII
jgi:hypothetical protein